MQSLRSIALAATASCCSAALAGEIVVLYDPDAVPATPQTLVDQGFEKISSDLFNQEGFYSAIAGSTSFDTGVGYEQIAAFFTHGLFTGNQLHPDAQTLDRTVGFRFGIDLAIDSEMHDPTADRDGDGTPDSASFGISVISSDLKGISVAFWENRIWISGDDADGAEQLFAQDEGVDQDPAVMSTLRHYDLEIKGDGYRLRADGEVILSGPLRNYMNFEGQEITGIGILNNFDKPNSITLGDPSSTARSTARIGTIVSETPFAPASIAPPSITVERSAAGTVDLTWDAVPGVVYSIRSGDSLDLFEEFDDMTATSFRQSYTDTRPASAVRFYKIVPFPDAAP